MKDKAHELIKQRFSEAEALCKEFPEAGSIQLFCKVTEYMTALEGSVFTSNKPGSPKNRRASATYYIDAFAYDSAMEEISVDICISDIQKCQWTREILDYLTLSGNIVVVKSDNYSFSENSLSLINADIVKVLDKEFDYVFNPCIECV